MAALDDLMHKAKELADTVGKATGELVDDSRMKLQELKLSSELKDAYERLGSVTYDGIKAGTQNQALVDLVVGEIDAIQKSLEELRAAKTAPETEEKYCPQCGTTNDKASVFCSRCGAPPVHGGGAPQGGGACSHRGTRPPGGDCACSHRSGMIFAKPA